MFFAIPRTVFQFRGSNFSATTDCLKQFDLFFSPRKNKFLDYWNVHLSLKQIIIACIQMNESDSNFLTDFVQFFYPLES